MVERAKRPKAPAAPPDPAPVVAPRVVAGVDLAGKVENPSVLAVLRDGALAGLERFHTDDELVTLLATHMPTCVGIDAPLSPPIGTNGSYAFRLADLHVRKAGLPIFPPALVATLTFRGMRLKSVLSGYSVIEVYPRGALLRLGFVAEGKKKGADEVRRTREFLAKLVPGVPDDVKDDNDVDAITAAYTAHLHADGATEAFGAADEGLIHLPRRPRKPST